MKRRAKRPQLTLPGVPAKKERELLKNIPRESGGRARHGKRPLHRGRFPVHVTMRVREGMPSLRRPSLFREIVMRVQDSFAGFWRGRPKSPRLSARGPVGATRVKILHYSVQSNHIHLMIEAGDNNALSRGMQGVAIRLARAINRCAGITKSAVWEHRYHAHELRSVRETLNALRYIGNNWRKHGVARVGAARLDPCASDNLVANVKRVENSLFVALNPSAVGAHVVLANTWLAKRAWLLSLEARRRGCSSPAGAFSVL